MAIFTGGQRKELKVLDPAFETKVRSSWEFQGTMRHLGAELIDVRPGYCEIHLPVSDKALQQHGFFHGGIVATLADSASGYATYTVLEPGEECLSAEFKVNFLSPAKGSKLIGRGSVIKVGRTLVVAEATISILRDGQEHECALMLHTLARVKHVKSGAHKG
ncbi:MAG TPA: PaaI family thioesterase [Planktothrix sp.]|jgi:uncharacterized protein (TIGR00369 family)